MNKNALFIIFLLIPLFASDTLYMALNNFEIRNGINQDLITTIVEKIRNIYLPRIHS